MKFFLFLFVLFSCAQKPAVQDFDLGPSVGEEKTKVSIDESKSFAYGPSKVAGDSEQVKTKEPVVALVLYPTLYHTSSILYALKRLEEEDIKVSIISSYGFGSLFAALYAQKKSASYVEWKLFGLFKSLKEVKIYSDEWKLILTEFAEKEFGEKKASQLTSLFIVPEWSRDRMIFVSNDKVHKIIRRSMSIEAESNPMSKIYPLDDEIKKTFAADMVFSLSFLSKYPSVTTLTGLQYGLVTAHLGKLMSKRESYGVLMTEEKSSLDELDQLTGVSALYEKLVDEKIQEFKNLISVWKEENTEALNN